MVILFNLGKHRMTRYPKTGKGTKWTIKELQNIPPEWLGDSIQDGSNGLVGEIRVSKANKVSIRFRYGFKWEGKKSWFNCGSYPANDMSVIRENHIKAQLNIQEGVDPRVQKKASQIEAQNKALAIIQRDKETNAQNKSFSEMYNNWIETGVAREDENKQLIRSFEKDVIPFLGSIPVKDITENDIRGIYLKILERATPTYPRHRTIVMLHDDIKQLFNWSEQRQPWRTLLSKGNPSLLVDITTLIPPTYTEERDRVLSITEIKQLHSILETERIEYQARQNKRIGARPLDSKSAIAIWICLSSICRIGELLMARWDHIDFDEKVWFIPRENAKGKKGKKLEHYVFLSDFTLKQFKQLYKITGASTWCFPSRITDSHVDIKSISKTVGDRQVKFKERNSNNNRRFDNSLVIGSQEWTPHDLRRTGATIMQKLKIPLEIIDRCQNHILRGQKVRRHYLKYDYREEKQEAWQKLGKFLSDILETT